MRGSVETMACNDIVLLGFIDWLDISSKKMAFYIKYLVHYFGFSQWGGSMQRV